MIYRTQNNSLEMFHVNKIICDMHIKFQTILWKLPDSTKDSHTSEVQRDLLVVMQLDKSITETGKMNFNSTYRLLGRNKATKNLLDCDQSNYSSRIIFSYTFTLEPNTNWILDEQFQRYGHSKLYKTADGRDLGFGPIGRRAIRSTDLENPT